jgi:hypothetical protein
MMFHGISMALAAEEMRQAQWMGEETLLNIHTTIPQQVLIL